MKSLVFIFIFKITKDYMLLTYSTSPIFHMPAHAGEENQIRPFNVLVSLHAPIVGEHIIALLKH